MAVATAKAIRDRALTVIEAITPTSLNRDKFRRYRNEGSANFDDWADKNQAAALRRFQIREVGDDEPPTVSDMVYERRTVEYEIRVAYPQTSRFGGANALDRDDVMNEDWLEINDNIGDLGRGNFSGANDCTPLGATRSFERGGAIDYLVIRASFEYLRSISANSSLAGGPAVPVIVEYTATGSEGTDFTVSIGKTMPDANYKISWSTQGITNAPIMDCPTGVSDRTRTAFRVTSALAFTAGDKLVFFLFEAS